MYYSRFMGFFAVLVVTTIWLGLAQEKIYAATCPCDIYAAGGTPCVAAHSTVRALYGTFNSPLYQVRRTSDNQLKEIAPLTPGGVANAAAQDSFLGSKAGTISIIYDQSSNGNHLTHAPVGGWLKVPAHEVDAVKAKIKINGYTAYGVYTYGNGYSSDPNVVGAGYRNNNTKGVIKGNDAEGMYGVFDGKHVSWGCCFDYGNAQTNMEAKGPATMESIYFGTSTQWGHGSGNGPWVMNDCEYGIQAGVDPSGTKGIWAGNTSIIADYVTGIVKSDTSNLWAIRACDAVKDTLKTMYRGRQYPGYYPKLLEGAIVLGLGGDNSNTGDGTFFEGAMTKGMPSDATENEVQKNIIAAGYGRTTTAVAGEEPGPQTSSPVKAYCVTSKGMTRVGLDMCRPGLQGKVTICLFDLNGRLTAELFKGQPASQHLVVSLDTKHAQQGVQVLKVSVDSKTVLTKAITVW